MRLLSRRFRIYNVPSLLEDLRKLYYAAGTGPKGVSFIFTDNEIKEEAFLEYINNVLSVGEIANLFPKDELDEIMSLVTPLMKKDDPRRPPTHDNLYDYFISRARNNLHLILCFSPVTSSTFLFRRIIDESAVVAIAVSSLAHRWITGAGINHPVYRTCRSVKSSDGGR